MVSQAAVQIANALEPDEGWWRSNAEDAITDCAETMLEAGLDAGLVEDRLSAVVSAVRGEYGE